MTTQLLYVVDPMCSWCYGFGPAFAEVLANLRDDCTAHLVMGGLAPDSDEPMDNQTRTYIQSAWRAVEAQCGTPFNHDFWSECAPRRSSYIACRAVIAARQMQPADQVGASTEWQMLSAIQRAYYTQARNPSDASTLIALAAEIGLDEFDFAARLASSEVAAELQRDFALRDQIGVASFPSLGMRRYGHVGLLAAGCMDSASLRHELAQANLLR